MPHAAGRTRTSGLRCGMANAKRSVLHDESHKRNVGIGSLFMFRTFQTTATKEYHEMRVYLLTIYPQSPHRSVSEGYGLADATPSKRASGC